MALNEIRQSRPGTISGILPAGAQPVGIAMMIASMDADTGERTFALAAGKADGFVTRAVRTTPGLTDEEQLFKFGMDTPFQAGFEGSLEFAMDMVVEGSDYIQTAVGTGQITGATAAGTKLSFTAGKFYVAQTGDLAQFEVVKQLTPEVDGNVRIHVKEIRGYLVP